MKTFEFIAKFIFSHVETILSVICFFNLSSSNISFSILSLVIELFFNKFGVFDEMDFNEIDESKLDEFEKANSKFQDWNEMKNDAAALMIKKKLGLD